MTTLSRRLHPSALFLTCILLTSCQPTAVHPATDKRPAHWAQPVSMEGVPNLHQLSANLYRSAQPTARGMESLKNMGIRTVINLRAFHSDRNLAGNTGLSLEHISMKTWHAEDEDIVRFLQLTTDNRNFPLLFHCQHGADRTGTLCAVYRIAVCGWSKEEAIREMTEGGFGFHPVWKNLIEFIENLDIDAIRKKAGLQTPPANATNAPATP